MLVIAQEASSVLTRACLKAGWFPWRMAPVSVVLRLVGFCWGAVARARPSEV